MAKFAISLCVLLVTCSACQAQLSMFPNLTNGFMENVTAGTAATNAVSAATSGDASSGPSTITKMAGDASSGPSTITKMAGDAMSAATSGDASSLLPALTNAVSGGMNLATSVAGSTNGLGSLLEGITNKMSSVANPGTSNPLLSQITASTTTWITKAANEIKTRMSIMMGVVKSIFTISESIEIVAMDSIKSALGQLGNVINSLTNSGMNVDSCISIASGIQEIAGTAMINTTICTRKIVETMESDCNRAITVMSVFVESLSSLAEGIEACAKVDFFSMLGCGAKVSSTTGARCVEGFGSTLSEVTSIMTKIANVRNELAGCGMKSAQEQVQKRILSATAEVAKCVVEMGQSGLSGASVENAAKAVEIAKEVLSTMSG